MRLFTMFVGMFLGCSTPASASGELPYDLRLAAASHGCRPVANFFDRPGLIDPPYLYGFLEGNREESALFWCESGAASIEYLLVAVVAGGDRSSECGGVVTKTSNFPGGLIVESTGTRQSGPVGAPERKRAEKAAVVRSFYDGVGIEATCRAGAWSVSDWD